jgi:SAM-dependent methyltransferase
VSSKYDRTASGWSATQYADSAAYLAHRARLIAELGRPLAPGDTVLDLACGDGGLAPHLEKRGLRYRGVDSTEAMVEEARRSGVEAELGDLNTYAPPEPVAATTCFRAIYYAIDRAAFFRRAHDYTTAKLVFDLNPRQYDPELVVDELRAAGFGEILMRPFFVPQRRALPRLLGSALVAAERAGPLARLALRYRFTYVVSASLDSDIVV